MQIWTKFKIRSPPNPKELPCIDSRSAPPVPLRWSPARLSSHSVWQHAGSGSTGSQTGLSSPFYLSEYSSAADYGASTLTVSDAYGQEGTLQSDSDGFTYEDNYGDVLASSDTDETWDNYQADYIYDGNGNLEVALAEDYDNGYTSGYDILAPNGDGTFTKIGYSSKIDDGVNTEFDIYDTAGNVIAYLERTSGGPVTCDWDSWTAVDESDYDPQFQSDTSWDNIDLTTVLLEIAGAKSYSDDQDCG
jgi:hypothetical protein